MKYKWLSTLIVFILLAVTSCDCYQRVHGVVVDANQKLPLKNVELIVGYSPKDSLKDVTKIYTDDKGTFDYARIISGLLSCPKIKIKVRKQGYKEVVKKYKSYQTKTDTIFLIKTTD